MESFYRCRLCLEESSRNINIFEEEDFSKMIELLTGIKVTPEDGLPSNSCLQCHTEVKSAMLTRYQIINSHKILLSESKFHINSVNNESKFGTNTAVPISSDILSNINCSNDKNNLIDRITEFVESEISEIEDTKSFKHNELISEISANKNPEIDDDDNSAMSGYETTEDISEENKKFDSSTCESSSQNNGNNSEATRTGKQEFDKLLLKIRCKKTKSNPDIKFRRKKGHKEITSRRQVQFKKKSSADRVKIEYDIKPEHIQLLKTVGKKDRVACPICQKEMFGMNLKNHLITHNFDPVICDTCGKTSKNAQALQDHINYYHKTTPDRFMCDKCGKGYRVRFMLERHEKKEHGNGEKDYECTICGKKFFEKLQLKNHINITHNKIKPFKCEHCGKGFGRRTQFVTHQLVHTKENRYHCQVCGKGFKIKQTMQTHLKGIHGIEEEKTIFCKICQRGFSSAQGLRAHINSRVHGLEKCEHCSEYITFEYKNIHLKEIHGIKIENSFS